jgi:hypothetical protein
VEVFTNFITALFFFDGCRRVHKQWGFVLGGGGGSELLELCFNDVVHKAINLLWPSAEIPPSFACSLSSV